MPAVSRKFVLGLALLLAAATAAADTVITASEVISCSLESVDASFLELRLPQDGVRIVYTRDIIEVRLPDSIHVAELATQIPQVRVTLDSGQSIPAAETRTREMLRLRLQRAREARAEGLPPYGDIVDPLPVNASVAEMTARCGDMEFVLTEYGRSDETITALLHEVNREGKRLRASGPGVGSLGTCCLCGLAGGVLSGCVGGAIGEAINPTPPGMDPDGCVIHGGPVGVAVGCAAGSVIGATVGTTLRTRALTTQHRCHIENLIRKANRAIAIAR